MEPWRTFLGLANFWDFGAFWETPGKGGFWSLVIRNHRNLRGFWAGHRAEVANNPQFLMVSGRNIFQNPAFCEEI